MIRLFYIVIFVIILQLRIGSCGDSHQHSIEVSVTQDSISKPEQRGYSSLYVPTTLNGKHYLLNNALLSKSILIVPLNHDDTVSVINLIDLYDREEIMNIGSNDNYCIALTDSGTAYSINLSNKKLSKYPFNPYFKYRGEEFIIRNFNSTSPLIVLDSVTVVAQIYSMEDEYWYSDFYKNPVLCIYNLENQSTKVINIEFPKNYLKYNYGNLNGFSVTQNENKIIVCFNCSDDIAEYDLSSEELKWHHSVSEKSVKDFLAFDTVYKHDFNFVLDHMTQSWYNYQILYDKYKHCYYRIFGLPLSTMNDDGSFNSFFDKQYELEIFDSSFRKIQTVKATLNFNNGNSFVTEQGLYISIVLPDYAKEYDELGGIKKSKYEYFKVIKI